MADEMSPDEIARYDRRIAESRIITLDDERSKRNPNNRMRDYCTREEMITSATTAALGVGEKVYNEIAAEHAEQFQKLEHVLWQKMLAELEARSLRGKLRALWARLHTITPSVKIVDAVDALDPSNGKGDAFVAEMHMHPLELTCTDPETGKAVKVLPADEEMPRFAAMTPEEYAPKTPK